MKEHDEYPQNFKVFKSEEKGLSELVKMVMGKPLNKSEQMSDWERRPLRRSQITYAGKLLMIYMIYFRCCFSFLMSNNSVRIIIFVNCASTSKVSSQTISGCFGSIGCLCVA